MKQAIIMAAGKGTRMKSDLPKVAHKVCGKTMVDCLIDELNKIDVTNIVTVLGYEKEQIEDLIKDRSNIAVQEVQLGTAHAVMQAQQFADLDGYTLVINGDCPVIKAETLNKLIEANQDVGMVVLTVELSDPKSYGRIIRDDNGFIHKIVEFKDCNEKEKLVNEINTGIYCFNNKLLFKYLDEVKNNNAQNEYYITDLVEIMNNDQVKIKAVISDDPNEVQGVNSQLELAIANEYQRGVINNYHLENGVVMIDPKTTYIDHDVVIESEVVLYPNVTIEKGSIIRKGAIIRSNSRILNSEIGSYSTVDSSHIINSTVKNHVTVGPFAHIREKAVINDKCRIGNFVELKKTTLGVDTKCAHLTYLGDSDIGNDVNVGCGVVTVNYDGKNKHRTVVKDGAFIGSNSNLIAPVTIGENALIAAGSTCTKNVDDGDMLIARPDQIIKPGYGDTYKKKV